MNSAKAQYEIISECLKRQGKGSKPILFDRMYNTPYVGVATTGCFAYIFNKNDFLIDTMRMEPTNVISRIYDYCDNAVSIKWNGVLKNMNKSIVAELNNENGEIILVDMKYVKKFGRLDNLQFKQCDKKIPVFVYDASNESLIGIIMPIVNNAKGN